MIVDYVNFHDRRERIAYIAGRFGPYLRTSVLDVGCDRKTLREYLDGTAYTGIDLSEAADIRLNLEQIERLPFEDGSFECVLCADVLGHLDNLHAVFAELIRVARGTLIIAWPNNWVNARKPIERGHGSFKHYGLPSERPADRHKWFFNISEARAFVRNRLAMHPEVRMAEECVTEKPRPFGVRLMRRLRYPSQERYWNRYAHTYWTVLRKRPAEPV